MSQCSVPTVQEGRLARHITIQQSQSWQWIHRPAEEQQLSVAGKQRLAWLRWHTTHGENVSLTCRHFALARPTFRRWRDRYRAVGLRGLEDRSRRPHRCQPPTWTAEQQAAVRELREEHPAWGKAKLQVLLARRDIDLSVSMVGRILRRLRASGLLHLPPRLQRRRGRTQRRPHAVRKPKDYVVDRPGDLVQIDTLDVAVAPGARFLQLSLVDCRSRWTAAEARRGKAALTMRDSLKAILHRLPFPIRGIQIDGGSEFKAEFEAYCAEQGIRLFVLPPRSPKLNGKVERMQRTYRDEFYACVDAEPRLEPLTQALRDFEHTYNTIRPHQALDYRTPQQYLDDQEEAA